jgi:deoxyribodipyrimidine photolyase-related protein
MKSFYEKLRRDTGILMTKGGNPIGNKFSFDIDNRESLPRDSAPPELPEIQPTKHVNEVAKLCDKLFPDHPGDTQGFWLPTTRKQSLVWLNDFLENRLRNFGTYEDAISFRSDFVYHSALSPLLNLGLITPKEVISKALKYADANSVPLNSLEGLIRQILGWREFVRGIYQNYSEEQDSTNFWKHSAKLADCWYDATTGIPPVDDAIQKALRLGYNHHIERLMVLSNVMLLSEISPREVHRWFMEMYVDSSDWVMGPNVYGMGQFSDGGIFVTKPYICGSNYILKMSDYTKGDWCDTLDGLYWSFVDKHQAFFKKNPRTSAVMGNLNRMDPSRKERIFKAAKAFRAHATSS